MNSIYCIDGVTVAEGEYDMGTIWKHRTNGAKFKLCGINKEDMIFTRQPDNLLLILPMSEAEDYLEKLC